MNNPQDKTELKKEYEKLAGLSKLALEGVWRRCEIAPISDRPESKEALIDEIMDYRFGEDWLRDLIKNPRTKSRILQKTDKPTNIKKILKEIDTKPNELRFRMQNPNKFDRDSFRRKQITKGVSIILGCPKENGTSFWDGKCRGAMETQALRFSREYFTKQEAAQWISKHTQYRNPRYTTLDKALTKATGLNKSERELLRNKTDEILKNSKLSKQEKIVKLREIGAIP